MKWSRFRQPALMKDPADENAVSVRLVEDDVLGLLQAAKAGAESVTWSSEIRLFCNQIEPIQQKGEVSFRCSSPQVCVVQVSISAKSDRALLVSFQLLTR
jgi:hypothetical protein